MNQKQKTLAAFSTMLTGTSSAYNGDAIRALKRLTKKPKQKDEYASCVLKIGKEYLLNEYPDGHYDTTKYKEFAHAMTYRDIKKYQEKYGGKVVKL